MIAAKELLRPTFEILPPAIRRAIQVHLRARDWLAAGIVFIHVPKAAGTSIDAALYGRFMGHSRAAEVRRFSPPAVLALPSFTVTRNPWDRLVSAYRFARRGQGEGGLTAGIRNPAQYQVPEFDSFERFVREWLRVRDLSALDNVFQPQWRFFCGRDRSPLVDHIGHVEDLQPTTEFIEEKLGRKIRFERQNRSGPELDYRSLYTPHLTLLVGEMYKDDVEMFGYDF